MHIIAIIPARGGSKGIPRKNILNFCDKPLLVWSIEQAKKSRSISKVYVTSDDPHILKISQKAGAEVIVRPRRIAGDKSSSEEALLHSIDKIESRGQHKIEAVVFLQATSPLRMPGDIDKAVKVFGEQKADSLFSASELKDFCLWKIRSKCYQSFNFDYRKRGRRQERIPLYLENGSIYIFKPEVLRRLRNRLGGKIAIYEMPFWQSYEIDELTDVEICEYYMSRKILNKNVFVRSC